MMARRARRGFTMLELLLALTMAATLGTGIVVALDQGRRAQSQATNEADARQVGRVALEWIARDLLAISKTTGAFNPGVTGIDAELGGWDLDTLFCTTTAHLPGWRELDETPESAQLDPMAAFFGATVTAPKLDADVIQVEYYVNTDPGAPPGLLRRYRVLPSIETTAEDEGWITMPLAREALAIDFRFYDGSEWQTDWDTSASSTYPTAIQVVLTVRVGPEGEDGAITQQRTFTRTVALRAEPFVEPDPDSQPAEGGVR